MREHAGLRTAAVAPTPNSCVNLRREMDMLFIRTLKPPQPDLINSFATKCEAEVRRIIFRRKSRSETSTFDDDFWTAETAPTATTAGSTFSKRLASDNSGQRSVVPKAFRHGSNLASSPH